MHSKSALMELPSPNIAPFPLLDPVRIDGINRYHLCISDGPGGEGVARHAGHRQPRGGHLHRLRPGRPHAGDEALTYDVSTLIQF